ncbi:MAG: type II toxin-antitoxin system HicB family antitoxin [Candidatus Baltobacteraceae bacterium]
MAETFRYAVLLEPEPDGSAFNVSVPALPEIATFGRTVEHALEMAKDAIALSLAYRRDEGLEIPAAMEASLGSSASS